MKYFLSLIIVLSSLSFIGCMGQADQLSLEPKAFITELKKDSGMLIDVRTPEEFAEGHLSGAVMIDYKNETFAQEINKLPKDKPVYLYCRSGKRSAAARDLMLKRGFKKVVHLNGGIEEWQNAGLPVEK